jgi:hypothetical protein
VIGVVRVLAAARWLATAGNDGIQQQQRDSS